MRGGALAGASGFSMGLPKSLMNVGGQMSCRVTGCHVKRHQGSIEEMKRQKEEMKNELTAHRESLRRDTNRGVRSQPDMQ